jgi:hypothetical protein
MLRRSGVAGTSSSRTSLLRGLPSSIQVGKAENQQVLSSSLRTATHGLLLASTQLNTLYVRGIVHSCRLDLLRLNKVLAIGIAGTCPGGLVSGERH